MCENLPGAGSTSKDFASGDFSPLPIDLPPTDVRMRPIAPQRCRPLRPCKPAPPLPCQAPSVLRLAAYTVEPPTVRVAMEGRASDGRDLSKPPLLRGGCRDDESSKSDQGSMSVKGGKYGQSMAGSYTPQMGSPRRDPQRGGLIRREKEPHFVTKTRACHFGAKTR